MGLNVLYIYSVFIKNAAFVVEILLFPFHVLFLKISLLMELTQYFCTSS